MDTSPPRQVILQDWGLVGYLEAWDRQTALFQEIIRRKTGSQKSNETGPYHLIFCEHRPVVTLGRSGKENHLLINEELLKLKGIEFYKINRGGDITYHGPGQTVMYPILDMEHFFTDVHRYIRSLENIVIRTLAHFELEAFRNPKYTGVWLQSRQDRQPKKICAIGVHMSRWVTLHGLAFNIHTDLSPFEYIIPCGIRDPDKGVTSLHLETDIAIDPLQIQSMLAGFFETEFQCTLNIQSVEG